MSSEETEVCAVKGEECMWKQRTADRSSEPGRWPSEQLSRKDRFAPRAESLVAVSGSAAGRWSTLCQSLAAGRHEADPPRKEGSTAGSWEFRQRDQFTATQSHVGA